MWLRNVMLHVRNRVVGLLVDVSYNFRIPDVAAYNIYILLLFFICLCKCLVLQCMSMWVFFVFFFIYSFIHSFDISWPYIFHAYAFPASSFSLSLPPYIYFCIVSASSTIYAKDLCWFFLIFFPRPLSVNYSLLVLYF
jgi:hypothetical protein